MNKKNQNKSKQTIIFILFVVFFFSFLLCEICREFHRCKSIRIKRLVSIEEEEDSAIIINMGKIRAEYQWTSIQFLHLFWCVWGLVLSLSLRFILIFFKPDKSYQHSLPLIDIVQCDTIWFCIQISIISIHRIHVSSSSACFNSVLILSSNRFNVVLWRSDFRWHRRNQF